MISDSIQKKRDFLFALFVSFMVMVNLLGSKITSVAGIRVSVGIFFMPVLFLITDIIGDVLGKKEADRIVNISVLMLILLFAMTFLCISVRPDDGYSLDSQYKTIFGSSLRMTLASLISFIISQKADVMFFSFWKKTTKGKHLWIRNNLSTICSQFLDTVIFEFTAFYKLTEQYTIGFVFSLILPYWIFKVILALLDTPLCYLGVKWLRSSEA